MKAFSKDFWDKWLQKFFNLFEARNVWLFVVLVLLKWSGRLDDVYFISGLGLIYTVQKYHETQQMTLLNNQNNKEVNDALDRLALDKVAKVLKEG